MKTITTVIFIFLVSLLQAQTNSATPNANFEDWTYSSSGGGYNDPDSWNCLNSTTSALGFFTCFKDSTTVESGKYSALLVTMSFATELVPGTMTTGTINTAAEVIDGGIPYTLRPDSITGWYQYTPVTGDNGDIEFYVFGANHQDTIGQAFFKTPTTAVGTWTRISLAVTYTTSATPDTALWIITSSDNQNTGHEGSELIVDSLGLVFNSTSAINNVTHPDNITVGPNPANGLVSINNNSGSTSLFFTLTDITGRKLEEQKITAGANYMELTGMPDGIYIYFIQNDQDAIIKTGKIVVQQ